MAEPFTSHTGLAVPLDRINVDTDQIIPKQFLKRIERTGFGQFLFYDWRFTGDGSPDPGFVLNEDRYRDATILLTGDNFGCGSSREHAPWALQDYGFRVIIAPSFADIFYNNCFKNGLLPVVLPGDTVRRMLRYAAEQHPYSISVDLEEQVVAEPRGASHRFEVDPFLRHFILKGLDEIGWTLQYEDDIAAYERTQCTG
ncbi:MAG: 3-isopropylmalate dehydratase small subunit [Gemmatimonadetes bacterium]|nr:3-isopropylmalate dehydratase small subunit [Gemmatimonadota bacterium]MYG84400.1 3-isopropylmalate dehydratase small subunit [Gemmatimonadota bacterium]MYJ88276.1 3-isopropylmalate dehydratase small subunit [Gemmatimonadota bacterium]